MEESYRPARIVRAKVEASAAIRSNLATAFRVSAWVRDFRWSAISWRSRWISLMLSFMRVAFTVVLIPEAYHGMRSGQPECKYV